MATPPVQELVEQAKLHQTNREFQQAHDTFVAAAEADPFSEEAHLGVVMTSRMRFIEFGGPDGPTITDPEAIQTARDELVARYRTMAEADPSNLAVGFALVNALTDPVEVRAQLACVLAVDPDHPGALSRLAVLAAKSGDRDTYRRLTKQAADADPDDAQALANWASTLPDDQLRAGIDHVVARFGDDRNVVGQMAWLSDRLADPDLTRSLFERGFHGPYAAAQLISLTYEDTASVVDFLEGQESSDELAPYLEFARALANAVDADDLLGLKAPAHVDEVPLRTRVITSLASEGRTEEAHSAAIDAIVEETAPQLWAAVEEAGLDAEAIHAEVARRRIEQSTVPAPVDLPHARTGESVTLASRKGKVTLLNFFFPGCGPCRSEFGYLGPMYERYADEPLEIICINVNTDEADLVVPFMDGNGYRFTPVQGDWEWAKEAYAVRGAPTNVLVDHEGRVIARPHIRTAAQTRNFAQLVDELLTEAKA